MNPPSPDEAESKESDAGAGGADGADGADGDGSTGNCRHCQAKKLGDVTTLNLTMLRAGVSMDDGETFALNVIPTKAECGLDIRVTPNTPIPELTKLLDTWTAEEGLCVCKECIHACMRGWVDG